MTKRIRQNSERKEIPDRRNNRCPANKSLAQKRNQLKAESRSVRRKPSQKDMGRPRPSASRRRTYPEPELWAEAADANPKPTDWPVASPALLDTSKGLLCFWCSYKKQMYFVRGLRVASNLVSMSVSTWSQSSDAVLQLPMLCSKHLRALKKEGSHNDIPKVLKAQRAFFQSTYRLTYLRPATNLRHGYEALCLPLNNLIRGKPSHTELFVLGFNKIMSAIAYIGFDKSTAQQWMKRAWQSRLPI